MTNLTTFHHQVSVHDGINAIFELGFPYNGFSDHFLGLGAWLPEECVAACAVAQLPMGLLIPETAKQERKDQRWYRDRFRARVGVNNRVRISAARRSMFDLLVTITGLAAPSVLARESASFRAFRERHLADLRFENRRYLAAHGRKPRAAR